jgi:hypothetical protein
MVIKSNEMLKIANSLFRNAYRLLKYNFPPLREKRISDCSRTSRIIVYGFGCSRFQCPELSWHMQAAMTGCARFPRIHGSEVCLIYHAVISVQKTLQGVVSSDVYFELLARQVLARWFCYMTLLFWLRLRMTNRKYPMWRVQPSIM